MHCDSVLEPLAGEGEVIFEDLACEYQALLLHGSLLYPLRQKLLELHQTNVMSIRFKIGGECGTQQRGAAGRTCLTVESGETSNTSLRSVVFTVSLIALASSSAILSSTRVLL